MDFKSLAQSLAMDKGMFERYATVSFLSCKVYFNQIYLISR